MRTLNISQADWANFAYDNMRALHAVGVECDSVKLESHEFYPEQSKIIDSADLKSVIQNYDTIQFFHDNTHLFNFITPQIKDKKVIVYHTSSFYRKYHATVNSTMNQIAFRSVAAMPEFIGLGAINEVYMVGAVDTDRLHPDLYPTKYKFAHFPSNPHVKGTDNIVEVMNHLPVQFLYSKNKLSHAEHIRRIAECEVYIEMLTSTDGNGSPYGNFGITALEAAALGKVVITQNNQNPDVYNQTYGFCAFNFAKDAAKLKRLVETFDNYEGSYLKGQQQITREWVVKNHGYKATGEYILAKVF